MAKELEKKQTNALANTADANMGFEGTDSSDMTIPRAKCLQALSVEIADGTEGLKQGDIINNITKEVMPEKFIPILFNKSWMRFEDGKVKYITNDENEAIANDGPENVWSAKTLNVLGLFEGQDFPVVITFRGASFKAGKAFLTLAKFKNQAVFNFRYKLTSTKEKNDKGTFFVLNVKPDGETTQEERNTCRAMHNAFSSSELKVDYSDAHEEAAAATSPY